MSEPTKRPWKCVPASQPNGIERSWDCGIFDEGDYLIVETFGIVDDHRRRPAVANAELICTAVNAHEAMKEALEEARNYIDTLLANTPNEATDLLTNHGEDVLETLQAALALAKKEHQP